MFWGKIFFGDNWGNFNMNCVLCNILKNIIFRRCDHGVVGEFRRSC